MKRLPYVLLLSLGFALLFSCQKVPELTLSGPVTFELSADGSSGIISFTTNRNWTASCSDSWIHVSPSFGSASDGQITVSILCDANSTYDDRSGTVTIKAEDLTQTITIKQVQKDALIAKKTAFNLPSSGGGVEVELDTNVPLDVIPDVDWIRFVQTKALNSLTVFLTVEENKTYVSRSGIVKITQKDGTLEQIITITQQGKERTELYGIWHLVKRTDIVPLSNGENRTTEVDYSNVNFFLVLSNSAVPHALAKKGSFTDLDLTDVDVDGTLFTYNATENQIYFKDRLWLTELPNYSMELKGTYDVLELTNQTLVIQQKNLLESKTYSFRKYQ